MDIIKEFGINYYLLVAQLVNFLIILYLLKRFAYKPIFQMLQKRKNEIATGMKNAAEAKIALEKALEEEKKILKKAQESAQTILEDAKSQADEVIGSAREETKVQVARMIQDAKDQIDRDARDMEKRLALSSAELAVEMIEKSVKDIFTGKEQKEAVSKMAKKLTGKLK